MLTKVISGGQTGVDIAALRAAKAVGLETGGWMPMGFKTEAGPRPEYADLYGMRETDSTGYPDRTERNVEWADCTILFALRMDSPGAKATEKAVARAGKASAYTWLKLHWFPSAASKSRVLSRSGMVSVPLDELVDRAARAILDRLEGTPNGILNVAGNRDADLEGPMEAWLTKVFAAAVRMQG